MVTNGLSQRVTSHHGFPTLGTTNEIKDKVPNTWQATSRAARRTILDGSAGNDPVTGVEGLTSMRSPDTERPLSATVTSAKAEVAAPHGGRVVPR